MPSACVLDVDGGAGTVLLRLKPSRSSELNTAQEKLVALELSFNKCANKTLNQLTHPVFERHEQST
eukprot:3665339-Amphidinium_carterae.1